MSLIAPDILAEAVGFSVAVSGPIFVLGLLLWLLGWRAHRFWIVLIATVAAGIVGLRSGTAYASQPVVAGLLLAVAAGAMALALVRLVAFAAGGTLAALAVHALAPQWQQPLVSFLTGGLLALLMFRVWTMALTSAAGTLLMIYSGLCLVSSFAKVDVVVLAEKRATAMAWICAGIVILGLIGQLILDRRRGRGQRPSPEQREKPSPPPSTQRPWWSKVEQLYRRAG